MAGLCFSLGLAYIGMALGIPVNEFVDGFFLPKGDGGNLLPPENFTGTEVPAQATTPSDGESPKEEKVVN
jgi:hypothetical protein